MTKIVNYIKLMMQDRGGTPNTKLHFGSLFAIIMVVGLFVNVDASLYQTFAFTTLALFGISAVDNISAPKITVTKQEKKESKTKTDVDVAKMVNNAVDKIKK